MEKTGNYFWQSSFFNVLYIHSMNFFRLIWGDEPMIKYYLTKFSNVIFAVIIVVMQLYLIYYYNQKLPLHVVVINVIILIVYCLVSLYSVIKSMKLDKTRKNLEQEKLYNQKLQVLHDNLRAFKHDFSNIIAGIGGYIQTEDMNGLKKYYRQLVQDCHQINSQSSLNPDTINNPAVYSILVNKYDQAEDNGIRFYLECYIDFSQLQMKIYEFTRILGILLDNAIEAASECHKKIIRVIIRNDPAQNRQLLIVENTYQNKDIDLNQICEKGFSTKPNNTGLGLWEVNRIIEKHKNLNRLTSKDEEFFRQQIEIYYP